MSRTLPTGFATLTEQTVFRPVFLAEIDWPGGMVRFWTGYGNLTWNGHTWTGTGNLGGISPISENRDQRANGLTLSLHGLPSDLVAEVLANDAQGRSGKLYLAGLAADGTLGADPYLIFDGMIDVTPAEDSGKDATISVRLEKELVDRRARSRRSTHEDQQIDYPGDMFFEYVAGLQDKSFNWGGKNMAGSAASPGSVAPGAFDRLGGLLE
jgi:hypothetical protein